MKILIAYSSGYGATEEVSEEIKNVILQKNKWSVDVVPIDDVNDIDDYDALIIGSSVRADKPLANVRDFFARYRHELPMKKVALFAVCLTANNDAGREKVKKEYLPQLTERYPKIKPIAVAAFGGKIDFDRLNSVMKTLMKRVLEKTGLPTNGSIDTRDWPSIKSWAEELGDKLENYHEVLA